MPSASSRAVIYARYSSEHQRAASIDDQVEVCRRYAEASGRSPRAWVSTAADGAAVL